MYQEAQEKCCTAQREETVLDTLENHRSYLIEQLKRTEDSIRVFSHCNPDQMKALRLVMDLGKKY